MRPAGGVLDEQALLEALAQRDASPARALYVFRRQPLPADRSALHAPRVIITPLLGGMSNIYLEQAYPIVRHQPAVFSRRQLPCHAHIVPH